ncbi:phosphatase [Sphingomonas taxi]|jgi:hypothetical protein|uniref:Phosphatase n=1 Tax=Sphingomonas taxi TaxID=1549858 RepID=A0A097EER4_9SPHN|nr:DUF3618 domain-containing protein [Sphingomonas taxi]AIT06059.1 phosphatase [Sphingomonas taxi]
MSAPLPTLRLAEAEAEALAARERLNATLGKLQVRLNPRALALQAARELTDKGGAAAQASLNTAVRNPGAVAGATAVAGLFLARHRIVSLFRRKPKHKPGHRDHEPGLGPQD